MRVTAAVEGDALQLWAFQAKPGCWRAFVPVTAAESGGCLPLTVCPAAPEPPMRNKQRKTATGRGEGVLADGWSSGRFTPCLPSLQVEVADGRHRPILLQLRVTPSSLPLGQFSSRPHDIAMVPCAGPGREIPARAREPPPPQGQPTALKEGGAGGG